MLTASFISLLVGQINIPLMYVMGSFAIALLIVAGWILIAEKERKNEKP